MRALAAVWAPAAIAMVVTIGACGKDSGSGVPVAPTGSVAPAPPSGATSGAMIVGTVMSGARIASLRPAAATMSVSVVGTSISATVDGSGRFTLQNVPTGDVILAFTGTGVDARVTVTGVNVNDQIRITVRVNGNVAEIDEDDHETADNAAEIEGLVVSTSCATNPPLIVVGTMTPATVNVQNARIHHGATTLTCAQIRPNDRVHVHGVKSGAAVLATDVNVETEHGVEPPPGDDHGHDGQDNDQGEVQGTVSGTTANHACPSFTFSVGSTKVTTNTSTKFEDISCAGVVNGITVEVNGTRTSANAITATKVEKK